MTDINDLRKAGEKARQETNASLKAQMDAFKTDKVEKIIFELKTSGIPHSEIDPLINEISAATDKNKVLMAVIDKGGKLGEAVIGIVKKII